MRVRVKEGHSRAGKAGTVLKQECVDDDGVVTITDSWFVHLDGEAAPRWIRRDALEERVRVKSGCGLEGLAGMTGSVLREEHVQCLVKLDEDVAFDGDNLKWVNADALEPEEAKITAICFPKVRDRVAIGRGSSAGKLGSVVRVDRDDGTVLVRLDGGPMDPMWFGLEDLLQGNAVAAIDRELKAQAALKAEIDAKERVEQMRKDVDSLRRLVEAQKAGGPEHDCVNLPKVGTPVTVAGPGAFTGGQGYVIDTDLTNGIALVRLDNTEKPYWFPAERLESSAPDRFRIASGWSDAGRIGRRIGPDVEVGTGIFYVPLLWEDAIPGGQPVFVLKCTLAPVVTPPPTAPEAKNERLRGMVYLKKSIALPLLWQGKEILTDPQYAEVVRRVNAWEALERLYQRMEEGDLLPDVTGRAREELGRIVKGGA